MKINQISLADMNDFIVISLETIGKINLKVYGVSMQPMLYNNRDTVTIVPPMLPLKKYDLPIYRMDDGRFIMHRVVKVYKDGTYKCQGDNRWECEDHITNSQIVGVVKSFVRNGKEIYVDKSIGYWLYTHSWQILHHFKKYYGYIHKIIFKFERRLNQIRDYEKIPIKIGDNEVKEITFRYARNTDLAEIKRLHKELIDFESEEFSNEIVNSFWLDLPSADEYYLKKIENSFLRVAVCDNKLIGYCCGYISHNQIYSYPIGFLLHIYVMPEFRSYGIGSKLMKLFKEYCTQNNCKHMKVTFMHDNESAQNFYEKFGFKPHEKTYICDK